MAYLASPESSCTGNRTVGSNPTPSAMRSRSLGREVRARRRAALRFRSCASRTCEPRQTRKGAAVSRFSTVPRDLLDHRAPEREVPKPRGLMAYQVLALKWRPQVFDEIVGQESVTRTLKNAIEQGRVAHAFLFAGVRGVGRARVRVRPGAPPAARWWRRDPGRPAGSRAAAAARPPA